MKMNTTITLLLMCITALLISCTVNPLAGGSGSEDTNSKVVCSVSYPDGSPADFVMVYVRSSNFLTSLKSKSGEPDEYVTKSFMTDGQGIVSIDSLSIGQYYLEIQDTSYVIGPVSSLVKVRIADSTAGITLKPVVLQASAQLSGYLDNSAIGVQSNIYVRIRGLDRIVSIDSTGFFAFKNLPACDSLVINYSAETTEQIVRETLVSVQKGTDNRAATFLLGSSFSSDLEIVRAILDQNGLDSIFAASVAFSVNGRVDSLVLDSLAIDTIPAIIGHLEKLRSLVLNDNQLNSLPDSLELCTGLRYLNCNANRFAEIPSVVFSLDSLTFLTFQNNALDSVQSAIASNIQLQTLFLQSNNLSALPPEIFNLPLLERFSVADNAITQLPQNLGNCTTLITLSIADNRISALPASFCGLTHLTYFFCEKNELDTIPECIGAITKLKSMNVGENNLSSLPESMTSLTDISNLVVDNNKLCTVNSTMSAWLDRESPGWDTTQVCQ